MVFSSLVFLCLFLPVTCLFYALFPGIRAKNIVLLAASLVFYAYGEPVYILLLLASAVCNYVFARAIGSGDAEDEPGPKRRKGILTAAVIVNIGLLAVFKYSAYAVECLNAVTGWQVPVPAISFPIGISFYTFQALSYVIDVYRGETRAQKNFAKVLLYITFFPQLIAGPIVKYHDIEKELDSRRSTRADLEYGIRRFAAGLGKKVLIANTMASCADALFDAGAYKMGAASAWLGAAAYLFQIYFDFSGYSDMAIGMGRMFGFHFKENFNDPYTSGSIREFWRRWHMSLSGWFLDYLYIPLGGNRKGKRRTVLNKFIVFLCTGIWHGANLTFLIWGLYHGALLMLEEYVPALSKKYRGAKNVLRHALTLLCVTIGFVIFRADTLSEGFRWIGRMFGSAGNSVLSLSLARTQMTPLFLFTAAAAAALSTPLAGILRGIITEGDRGLSTGEEHPEKQKYSEGTEHPEKQRDPDRKGASGAGQIGVNICSAALLFFSVLALASGTYNPFIYFRF